MIKKAIKSIFNYCGIEINKKNFSAENGPAGNTFTMHAALIRAAKRSIKPATIFDIGAAEGKWTLEAMNIWPNAAFCLFEPLEERYITLTQLSKNYKNIKYVNKGAGNTIGEITFYVTDDLDGSGIADNGSNAPQRKIKTTTIDYEARNLQLSPPFLIKLDTHGYEVPILEGATETLKQTQLIIVECYGLQIAPGSLLFWEMCRHMDQKGFRLVEIVDIVNRAKDNVFWQCDAFFIPNISPCFSSTTYH